MRRLPRLASILVVVAAVTFAGAPSARAFVPERTPQRELESDGRRLMNRPAARGTTPGVVIMRGGRILYGHNARRSMVPASLMKLATTAAAIARFGPDHRFQTRVFGDRNGATVGTMYLVGGGDPTFSTASYRRARFLPKPTDEIKRAAFPGGSPTVGELAARVARSGIDRVNGDLIADESLFDRKRTQPGWLRSYTEFEPDSGYLTALSLNEGRGDPKGETLLPNPALSAGVALRDALARRGVFVDGAVRLGKTPPGVEQIARVQSPPVAEIVDFVNRYSINFHAEVLLKGLGARYGGAGTSRAGLTVVEQVLRDLKVPLDGFDQADGSGLSLQDRMTPRTVAVLLNIILTKKGPGWDELRDSIAVAGRPGTLQRRMRGAPTGGNLRGKTGQVRRVRAMAGWVTGLDGVPIVYVAMFNDAPSPFSLTTPLDLFGISLAHFPRA